MNQNYRDRLSALGFSDLEVCATELVLVRTGMLAPGCEHERLKFITCYESDDDPFINHERWWKGMTEIGFKADAILLAEHALDLCPKTCELCPTKGNA